MSFNGAGLFAPINDVLRARLQMLEKFNVLDHIWWKLMPGVTISVRWPVGWTKPDHLGNQANSADPNDHYRPELERVVGKQGWDWYWKVDPNDVDSLIIKFRKSKENYASYFALKWS